jgi:hypothetical protein
MHIYIILESMIELNGFYIHMYVIYVYYSFFLLCLLYSKHVCSTAGCVEAADDPEGVATRKPSSAASPLPGPTLELGIRIRS